MMATPEEITKLRTRLVNIEIRKIVENISWTDIEQGIAFLTDDEKEKILKAILGNADSAIPLIQKKLNDLVRLRAESSVNEQLTNGTFSIDYINKIIE